MGVRIYLLGDMVGVRDGQKSPSHKCSSCQHHLGGSPPNHTIPSPNHTIPPPNHTMCTAPRRATYLLPPSILTIQAGRRGYQAAIFKAPQRHFRVMATIEENRTERKILENCGKTTGGDFGDQIKMWKETIGEIVENYLRGVLLRTIILLK